MIALAGACCILIGAWLVVVSALGFVRGLRSRSWPMTEGVIRRAKTFKKFNSHADEVWRQELEYTYRVNEKVYRGTRLRFGIPAALSWSNASLFQRGDGVDVYYSPSRPTVCALERGVSPFALIVLAGGGFALWIGVRLMLVYSDFGR